MKTEMSAQSQMAELAALHLFAIPESDRQDALQAWVDSYQGPNCLKCSRPQMEAKLEAWLENRSTTEEVASQLREIEAQSPKKKEQAELAFNFLNTANWQS